MTLDEFLDLSEGAHPSGGGYAVHCPAHEDRQASLGVTEGDDGRILLTCYAGCETGAVLEAMGLRWSDLFPNTVRQHQDPEIVYDYADESGAVLFQAVRFPGKRFRQRHYAPDHPDAKEGGWVWDLKGVRRVLYRLPELIAHAQAGATIYVTEGEKDAERVMAETGRFATTNPMGAGSWRPEFAEFFTGAKAVIILQDRDESGRRHAAQVRESLHTLWPDLDIRVFQAKRGKDVSDHFDAGYKMEEMQIPRPRSTRGVVSAAAMAEAGMEYLHYRPTDLPGWELLPGIPASVVKPGRLYAGGGYTGDGKSALALQGTRALASLGVRCGYFSMEMSDIDLRNRFVSHRGVPLWLLEQPWELKSRPAMLAAYSAALEEMAEWSLDIIYDTALTPERVVEETTNGEYEFVVIDHIHRIGWGERRQLEQSIQALTNLTLDANIPMLVLCQLRRYQRGKDIIAYPEPVLQDFRETEMLGNEASLAFAIWRARDATGLSYVGTQSHYRVLKNRHTSTGKDKAGHVEVLNFDTTTQLFSKVGEASAVAPSGSPEWED